MRFLHQKMTLCITNSVSFCFFTFLESYVTWVQQHLYTGRSPGLAGRIQWRPHPRQLHVDACAVRQQQLQTLSVTWWETEAQHEESAHLTLKRMCACGYLSLQPRGWVMPALRDCGWRRCAARWALHKQHCHWCKSWREAWHHLLTLTPPVGEGETVILNHQGPRGSTLKYITIVPLKSPHI